MFEDKEYTKCFACGKDNPYGLKLDFFKDKNWVVAEFIPHENYQGYHGILHGGITTTLMDEAMAKSLFSMGIVALSVKIEVNFKKKIEIGEKVIIKAKLIEQKRKIFILTSHIESEKGEIKAEAKGFFQQYKGLL
jgi:uncharacterized protein (TIGR00369 family)